MHLLNIIRDQAEGRPLTVEERAELGRFERLTRAEREAELRAWRAVVVAGRIPADRPSRAA